VVLAGRVPTASGFHRHRSVDPPRAVEALEPVLAAAVDAGADPLVHCCAADVPVGLLRQAGARAVSVDASALAAAVYDEIGALLDAGDRLYLGIVPATDPPTDPPAEPTARAVADRARRLLDMLGYETGEVADRLVLTPACGMAGATPSYVRSALAVLREAASALSD
jgi:hypothetical protein